MPPPIIYRFEPRRLKDGTMETWENYITRVAIHFGLSVYERTQAINNYKKYTKDGVDASCAGYVTLRESGLYDRMKADVARLRPERTKQQP